MKSLRFRITLLFSGILFLILVVFNAAIFFNVRAMLLENVDETLRIKAGEIASVFHIYEKIEDLSSHPLIILEELLNNKSFRPKKRFIIDDLWRSEFKTLKLNKDYINILGEKGNALLQSTNLSSQIRGLLKRQFPFAQDRIYYGTAEDKGHKLRVINYPYLYKKKLLLIIQVATPLNPTDEFLKKQLFFGLSSIAVILILTSFLGSFFVKRILEPVAAVTATADNITYKDLSARISRQETDVEMEKLILSFNAMIERLEKSFKHINEFNSHVAHELKTPLAILRGELELAAEQMDVQAEDKKIIYDCLDETDRMIRIVKDLLLISKLDYQPQILNFKNIDFKNFLKEVYEHSQILASEKKIGVRLELPKEKIFIEGDKVHLRRLFLNIIMNAIKFTPENGTINLNVSSRVENIYADIVDTGEGIRTEDLPKIFDKFFQVERKEKTSKPGNGLGLSIALSIAKAHRGDIQVESQLGKGSTFTVILPKVV